MSDDDAPAGAVSLSDALASLRSELTLAWSQGGESEIRLRPTSIELTLQMGVTSSRTGRAGVKWWLFEVGGERGRETAATETVKLVLEPQFPDPGATPS